MPSCRPLTWPFLVAAAAWLALPGAYDLLASAQARPTDVVITETFRHADGTLSASFKRQIGDQRSDVYLFTFGGSGCVSWRDYMTSYFRGLTGSITVLALNKRHVPADATGATCGPAFATANMPERWVADYTAFIVHHLRQATVRPRRVVLLGVSEGAYVAVAVAATRWEITDLAIIGDGAWSMRQSLQALDGRDQVEAAWRTIAADPDSLEKTWMGHPYRWWSAIMDLDPSPEYLKLTIPILLGVGQQDHSVPVDSAMALDALFAGKGKRNITLRIYPGADHALVAGSTNYRQQYFEELSRRLAP